MIKVLNSKTRVELEEIQNADRIETVLEIKKVLQKYNLMPHLEEYWKTLYTIATDKAKFAGIKGHLVGKAFLEALNFDLIIKHVIKHIFFNKPIFEKYTEVDEVFRKLINLSIPCQDRWDHFCEIIE